MKKILLFFAAIFACTLSTFAHDFEVDGIYYNIIGIDSVEVTYYGNDSWNNSNKYFGSVTIPETVTYNSSTYHITSIGNKAFYYSYSPTITIPNSVTTIGEGAFSYCSNLTNFTIPESVTSIGNEAFRDCSSLTTITIPSNLTSISYRMFLNCNNLTSITIPNNVISIGESAFSSCTSLTTITIPNSVTSIGDWAFAYCSRLTEIDITNSVTTISSSAFVDCPALETITVAVDNSLYKSINNCLIAKRTKQLILGCKSSIIPTDGSVTTIGKYAFRGAEITSINIPLSITSIGEEAFYNCSALEEVHYTGTIETWCKIAFFSSFRGYPSAYHYNFYSYSNPLYNGADFYLNDIKVTDITIPQGTSTLNNWFLGCTSLQSVIIPNSVSSISPSAFEGCINLQSIIIPSSVSSIGTYAFLNCTSLQSVTLPSTISSISDAAFDGCTYLQSAICKRATPPSVGTDAFPVNTQIIVPCGSTDAYWTNTEWAKYPNYKEEVSFEWNVQSADETQGTVTIVQRPLTCDNPEIIIQAKPALGYQFDKWNDGNTDNPRTLVLSDGDIYTAYFVEDDGFIHVENVTLSESTINVSPNQSQQLSATITPTNASVQNVTWSSSHPEVATISESGLLQAITLGTTTITVTTEDGGFTATCQVNVSVSVTNITLDETTLTLVPNKAQRLTATILPEDATNKNFTWKSSNEDVAIVLNNGLILALATGNTTITATTDDGGLTATCDVTVTTVSGISLDKTSLELSVGDATQLTETIIATEASYQLVNWTTSDANVATVENGLVTAVGAGVAAIGVATVDGGFVATCAVTVKAAGPTTEVQQVAANPSGVQKVLVDGVIYIVKPNGDKYLVDGRKVE